MDSLNSIPRTQHLFQRSGDLGSLSWRQEGFASDPVYTFTVSGKAGSVEVTVEDARSFLTGITSAVVDPDWDRCAQFVSEAHYVSFKFAQDIAVCEDVDGLEIEPHAWGVMPDGSVRENKRGSSKVPAYMTVEVFSVDQDAPRDERLQLVAMATLERPYVEKFGWVVNEQLEEMLASA